MGSSTSREKPHPAPGGGNAASHERHRRMRKRRMRSALSARHSPENDLRHEEKPTRAAGFAPRPSVVTSVGIQIYR